MTEETEHEEPIQTVTITLIEESDGFSFTLKAEPKLNEDDDGKTDWDEATDALRFANMCHRLFVCTHKLGGVENLRPVIAMMESTVDTAVAVTEQEDTGGDRSEHH